MKKLLIALTAVVSFAGVAFAEMLTGTSFEGLTTGSQLDPKKDDNGGTTGTCYWSYSETESPGYISNETYTVSSRPAMWENNEGHNFLNVDTSTILFRNINGLVDDAPVPEDIGNGIYVDTVVQFTASDATTIDTDAADKLVVWMQTVDHDADGDIEAYTETNLIVTAGLYEEGKFGPKDYKVTCPGVEVGKWHRLTIKSMKVGTTTAAFVVFIDGVAVTSDEAKSAFVGMELDSTAQNWLNKGALFPSLVRTGDNKQKLLSLGVEGSGFIDDIAFTTTAPDFAADGTLFTLNWDKNAFTALALNGKDLTVADGQVILPFGTTDGDNVFELTYTLADGFSWLAPTCDAAVTFESDAFTAIGTAVATLNTKQALYQVGQATFDTFAAALAAALEGDGTIKLVGNAVVEFDPDGDAPGSAIINEGETVVLDLAGKTLTGSADNADYGAYTLMVTGGDLTVIDTVGGGKIVPVVLDLDGESYTGGAIGASAGTVLVEDGIFDGMVDNTDDAEITITGGSFIELNPEEVTGDESEFWGVTYVPEEGYVVTYEDGYWTVTEGEVEKYTATFLVEGDEYDVQEDVTKAQAPEAPEAQEGYTFVGWKVQDTEDSEIVEFPYALEDDTTFVAVFAEAPVETYAVTWDETGSNARAFATTEDGTVIENEDTFVSGTEIYFKVTPNEGYEYATAPDGWTFGTDGAITATFTVADKALEVAIPVATAKTYAVTWDDTAANATAVAKVEDAPIASGDKFEKDTEVAFVVTPADNYEYATAPEGWKLEEDGTITATFTVGEEALTVTIPVATAKEAPGGDWDIPGTEGGIMAIDDGAGNKSVEFTSIAFTATGATVGLKAGKIDANGQIFGLVCKTDLTSKDTFVINATLTAVKDAATGTFAIEAAELTGKDQLFVIGVGPAAEQN